MTFIKIKSILHDTLRYDMIMNLIKIICVYRMVILGWILVWGGGTYGKIFEANKFQKIIILWCNDIFLGWCNFIKILTR